MIVMRENTRIYAIRALKRRVGELEKFLAWQNRIIERSEKALQAYENNKETIQEDGLSCRKIYPDTEVKLAEEAREKISKVTPNLREYKKALEELSSSLVADFFKDVEVSEDSYKL